MATKAEILNAVLKGTGRRPTAYLLRWKPSVKNPLQFDLLEVMKCASDGAVVTKKSAQSPLGTHLGHSVKSPSCFTVLEFLKVQLRIIQ